MDAGARRRAAEIEQLGFGTLWLPEAVNRDAMVHSTLLLGATTDLVVATGIVPLYARDAMTTNASWRTIEEAYPGRFVLGLGVSHKPMVESIRKTTYTPPLATMRQYLDDMDASLFLAAQPTTPPRRVLAALGPEDARTLGRARRRRAPVPRNARAHRDGTRDRRARQDPRGRAVGRAEHRSRRSPATSRAPSLAIYLGLPNYMNNWKRLGFTDADLADGGSDRFVDAIVAWGDDDAIKSRVEQHLDAGAGHVCIQVIPTHGGTPIEEWRRLSAALI